MLLLTSAQSFADAQQKALVNWTNLVNSEGLSCPISRDEFKRLILSNLQTIAITAAKV